ncbi:MAG TPA: thioredoxin-like domain-containing protein [Paludibacter sp.]
MKIKIVFYFILAIILTSCGNRPVKTELPGTQKITLQLNGKKYNELYLYAYLPGHIVIKKIFAGQSEDGYKWIFNIPDSINEMVNFYHITTKPFDFNTNTTYSASFKGLTNADSSYYDYVYDEKNPILEATYIDTKLYEGVKGDGNYFKVNDTLWIDGISRNEDLFSVDFKKRNTELELSMKYKYFSFMNMDNYEIWLAEKDSISTKYPDSKYLMGQFYLMSSSFKNMDDAKKIYANFSKENKSTWFGKESGNYIANYKKLYSSGFENVLLKNSDTEISESIIRDSTKFTLVIFSASWCSPCHKIIPELMDVYKDLNGKLEMVYISLDQRKTVNDWKKLIKEKSIPWRSLVTVGRVKEIEDKYDAGSIPHMLLVYPDKSVKKIDIRQKDDKEMLYQLVKNEK